jgi:hypothetical protein
VAVVVAANAQDSPTRGQGAVAKSLEQGRHQFAPNQIAGAAKQNKVKGHGQKLH